MKQLPQVIFGEKDYGSFGMVTVGRSWSLGSEYRYGFNRMENDNETYGSNNAFNFGERIYDSRIGVWLSIDKKWKLYPSYGPYSFAKGNPILFVDIDGNEVKNYYDAQIESVNKTISMLESELNQYRTQFGTIDKRKDFTGTKEEWQQVQQSNDFYKSQLQYADELSINKGIVDRIISDWIVSDPDVYKEANTATNIYNEPVDMYLKVKDLFESEINAVPPDALGGYNEEPKMTEDNRPSGIRGVNTITLTIEVDYDDRFNYEFKYGQNILNHEVGHFLYFAKNTKAYMDYIDQLIKDNRELNGGHNTDDPSGQNADIYGKK